MYSDTKYRVNAYNWIQCTEFVDYELSIFLFFPDRSTHAQFWKIVIWEAAEYFRKAGLFRAHIQIPKYPENAYIWSQRREFPDYKIFQTLQLMQYAKK